MADDMPPAFWQGIEQFNQGNYYDCHDTLEALWMEASEPDRSFYQGILQLAVALYHLKNHNQRGATILLGEGSNRLQRYRPDYGNIDVDALLDQSTQFLTVLQQTDLTQHPDYKTGNLVSNCLQIRAIGSLF
jgi:predicted metal-dependent hydrolase